MRSLGCSRRCRRSYTLDPHQAAAITDSTLQRYRRAARSFTEFMYGIGTLPDGSDDWDDALFAYKQQMKVSKSDFEDTVAAVEFFFPRFRGAMKRTSRFVTYKNTVIILIPT